MARVMETEQSRVEQMTCFTPPMTNNLCFGRKMVLEWREREYEDIDREALQDPLTLNSLRRCGLLKFFHTMNMHA